ncbi:hypothetical protein ACYA5M_25895 [Klebsiella pneumoniae]|uniref:hypothetical protein n=1 Tax=Klebsiella pneumoniae TaxID=573 RepID=UPI001CBEA8FF|nr:hypothetical protein [Klebsiella pneumoniae]MBZ1957183.1 hypothetical protein [Klebsiella pneumoniae]
MTTDITELALMKGQKVEAPYYLAECTECGKMYPSSQLIESRNYMDGDADCYCPHCNADDADIADLGSGEQPAAMAWNYQQARIDVLVEALEKAQQQIIALQQRHEVDPRTHEIIDLKERIDNLESFRTAYMEWGDKTDWMQTDKRFDFLKPWGKHRADVLKAYIEHLESRTVTVKLPRPGFVTISGERTAVYLKADVDAVLAAAGIGEAE